MPELGGGIAIGDSVVLVEPAEVVDPNDVIQVKAIAQPVHPPRIAGLFVIVPAVKGIAPELPGRGEGIRGTAGDLCRLAVLIQLEKIPARPGVRAVERDVDRDVPDDLYAALCRVGAQGVPLRKEEILLEFDEADLLCELFLCLFERLVLPRAKRLRPFQEAFALLPVF